MSIKIVFLASIAVFVSGCQVYSDSWDEAEKLCAQNGGVRFVVSFLGDSDALCQNGAKFSHLQESKMPK